VGVDRYELNAPAAALARMIVERPRNDPISTILPGAETRRAASQSRRACASVSQPSTSPVCANAS
jgi:hypothetical protein